MLIRYRGIVLLALATLTSLMTVAIYLMLILIRHQVPLEECICTLGADLAGGL